MRNIVQQFPPRGLIKRLWEKARDYTKQKLAGSMTHHPCNEGEKKKSCLNADIIFCNCEKLSFLNSLKNQWLHVKLSSKLSRCFSFWLSERALSTHNDNVIMNTCHYITVHFIAWQLGGQRFKDVILAIIRHYKIQ